jgi:hypothetical protein
VGFISGVANLRPKKKFLRLIADCIVAQKVNIFGKFSKLLFKDQFGLATPALYNMVHLKGSQQFKGFAVTLVKIIKF